MPNIGEKLDVSAFSKTHRPFDDLTELVSGLSRTLAAMSWGARGWTRINSTVLRFRVSGHHHDGYVFLMVNGSDLFDAFLTTTRLTVKQSFTDIYVSDLVDVLDVAIERLPAYHR